MVSNMKKINILISLILLNIIYFSMNYVFAYDNGREVYVRHINKDTGAIIGELSSQSQEEINEDGSLELISNSSSDDAEIEYNEYYDYAVSSTMEITKSLVLRSDGRNYTYLGANKCTMNSLDEAYSIMEQKKSSYRAGISSLDMDASTNVFTTTASNNNDVTIIDFYYTVQDATSVQTKLLSNTNVWTGIGNELNSNITYVPTGGSVLPYFITPKYIIKDLSYRKEIEDNKVTYVVDNFKVYRLESSYLKSSNTVNKNGKEISGHLVGSSNDTVFSGVGDTIDLPVKDETKQEITNELNSLLASSKTNKIPTNSSLNMSNIENSSSSDFVTNGFMVNYRKYNGLRSAKGNVTYTSYDVMSGATSQGFERESTNEHFINVYTPIQLALPEVTTTSAQAINHSNTSASTVILADDSSFELRLRCIDSNFIYYNNVNDYLRADFVDYYYVMFDFDVTFNGKNYQSGEVLRITNTARQRDGYTYARVTVSSNTSLSRNSDHKMVVIAAANNAPEGLINEVAMQEYKIQVEKSQDVSSRKYLNDSGNNEVSFSNDVDSCVSYCDPSYTGGVRMYADGYYFAMQTVTVRTSSKLYDFKISDCTDLAYKSVFRNLNSATDVNTPTGNNYYSGIRRMLVYTNNNKEYTRIIDRDDMYINGTSSTKTLPLGPYKHTTASYISAPKLGYRIAFDLKTTGYYMANDGVTEKRYIEITPSYYFISKDGATIVRDIDLYYKDSSGRYKNFENSNYTISFIPNDGYRYKSSSVTSDISHMSTKYEPLNIASSQGYFTLTDKMMSSDESKYMQAWYGEFKLPNTTIAVRKGDSISNPLTDGYIAVKFGIRCVDTNLHETISYDSEDISSSNRTNTTQWDYEGYLGFSNLGNEVTSDSSLRLQLEKGIWVIDNQETYNFVKGTVVLFDAHNRAASDIE